MVRPSFEYDETFGGEIFATYDMALAQLAVSAIMLCMSLIGLCAGLTMFSTDPSLAIGLVFLGFVGTIWMSCAIGRTLYKPV